MRIGLVTGEFPPMEGGVGAFTQELAKALANIGHEIHIITDRRARPFTGEKRVRDLLEPIQLDFANLHPIVRHWRWSSVASIVDVVLRYELDVVNIQYQAAAYDMRSPAVNLLPWRLKGVVKTAVTFHDLRVPYLFPKAGRLRETAVQFMARQAHGVVVTNLADYQQLTASIQSPVRQIPIGSNIITYTPTQAEINQVRRDFGLADSDRLLGYFGFLNESKGADTLLQALARLDERHHLVFIGGQTGSSDPDNNQIFLASLQQLVADLGLQDRVHWTGFVPDQQVSVYLHAADVMVMPYRDGVSLRRGTLMAVLAHGRSLITTTPTIPTPELAHGKNVWLVPVDEPTSLAEAVQTILDDDSLRRQLGKGAIKVAGLFSWEKIAAETAVFFEFLLANK
ncbi:MAG: glycosyltransferase family 4 protein [Ardenticatenaceae bacterium]|nr:glycosyltransferase family 4 protein [Ardenticatenaceae bacterium]MCB9445574.1 glycosyltransferase family 4 protein [Ardenticatenaceae bacterium]